MSEYIDRDQAIDAVKFYYGDPDGIPWAIRSLKDIPAADVRPVVLCRDCKHKGWIQELEHGKSVNYCRLIERCVDKQFFCAAGERKTNRGAEMREDGDENA